jgi:peptide/nickel transport system substrate-binding protein
VNVETVLRRNPAWWGKPVHNLDRISLRPLDGPDTRMKRLLGGKVDLVAGLPTTAIRALKGHKKFDLMKRTGLKTIFLFFDQGRDPLVGRTSLNPFKDARVREAMRRAIDYDELTEKILKGSGLSMSGMIAPKLLQSQLSQIVRVHDKKRAQALLAAAGYRNGFHARFDCPANQFRLAETVCTAITENLRDAGIKLDLNMLPMREFAPKVFRPASDYHIGILAWQPPTYDAWNVLYNLLGTWNPESRRGLFNLSRVSNLRIDELTDRVAIERDKQLRSAMIVEALQIVRDNNYYIPLYRERHLLGKRRNIKTKLRPDGAIMLQYTVKK